MIAIRYIFQIQSILHPMYLSTCVSILTCFYDSVKQVQPNNWLCITIQQQYSKTQQPRQQQMSDQQILPCVMCGQHHQQMLMLVCMHDPCINCAAIHYCSSQHINSNDYQCAKCGQLTQLDSSSIVQLQRVYQQLKGKKRYDYRRGQGSITDADKYQKTSNTSGRNHKIKLQTQTKDNNAYVNYSPKETTHSYQPAPMQQPVYSTNTQSYTPISQPSYPSNPYNNIILRKTQQPFYMCQTHPQEQLSYFCFNCNLPICPECAIHGTHREHEVQTTRKAIKTIKANLQKCQEGVNQEINSVIGIIQAYKNRQKEMGIDVKKEKDSIRDHFNQLRNILSEKQKQFQKTLDSCYETNNNIIRNQSIAYDRLIEQHTTAKKNIQSTLKKDDLAILQQYNKRQKQANTSIQSSKTKRYNPDLEGLKEIDYSLFRDQIDQLSGIMGALRLTVQPKQKNG